VEHERGGAKIANQAMTLHQAISRFRVEAKSKLSNPAASGAPEDQLRAPLEALVGSLAELVGLPPGAVVAVGETSVADLRTRPDYADHATR